LRILKLRFRVRDFRVRFEGLGLRVELDVCKGVRFPVVGG